MSDYDNTNSGALWVEKAPKSEKHPNMKGNISVMCPACQKASDYWMAGWAVREPEGKRPNIKLSVTAKDAQRDGRQDQPPMPPLSSDIPF